VSADLHTHQNYGGTYKDDRGVWSSKLSRDLNIVHNLVVNKEQRFPDLNSLGERDPLADPTSRWLPARNSHQLLGTSRSVEHESAIAAARLRGLSEYGRGESVFR